ncbi:MAG TPA: hypothetical protein VJ756_16385 [Terriglobales bacterium]|nr:hypothetical protein [Terriglobales bacterium]
MLSRASRVALVFALCALSTVVAAPSAVAQSPLAAISVETKALGRQIPKDFVGFSLEVSTAGQGLARFSPRGSNAPIRAIYALGVPETPNQGFLQFMRNLGPGILRLGGNSQDNTCWKRAAAPHPGRCQGELTAADFQLYSEAAKATGWRLIVGLNLKQNSSQWALSEVTQGIAKELTPEQVLGLELGNEPDLFGEPERPKTYSPADLVKNFRAYVETFKANPVARQYPVIGPAICCRWRNAQDLGTFMDGVGVSALKLVTVHEYAKTTCNGRRVKVEELLAPELMTRFNDAAHIWVGAAHQRKLPIALAETNSASCGGMPGVSNAFASTLWGLDWLFSAAEDGFTGVNFHISYRPGGSSYNPIDTYGAPNSPKNYKNVVEPLYYAMYLFAHSTSGNHLLPASVQTTANIRAYATSACSNCAVNVVVLNKDSSASGTVRVHLDRPTGSGKLLLLKAPSLDSLSPQVTYGGARFDSNGRISPLHTSEVRPDSHGNYKFELPRAAAGLLTISLNNAK